MRMRVYKYLICVRIRFRVSSCVWGIGSCVHIFGVYCREQRGRWTMSGRQLRRLDILPMEEQ